MIAGMKFGIRLMRPSRTLLKITISSNEIRPIAMIVARNMLYTLRWNMCEKTMLKPLASVARPGALACSQSCARASSSRKACEETPRTVTVRRVADFPMSMRSFRSAPNGSDSSYSRRYWAASSGSSGRR